MNHQDKAWLMHRGRPLISQVIESLERQTDHIVISRNREDPRYDALGYPCVADAVDGYQGPLAGIMSCLPLVQTPATLVVPCDMPDLPDDLADRMLPALGQHSVTVASDGRRVQPLVLLARTSALADITQYLATGGRSVMGWLGSMDYGVVAFPDSTGRFRNINEPSQLDG